MAKLGKNINLNNLSMEELEDFDYSYLDDESECSGVSNLKEADRRAQSKAKTQAEKNAQKAANPDKVVAQENNRKDNAEKQKIANKQAGANQHLKARSGSDEVVESPKKQRSYEANVAAKQPRSDKKEYSKKPVSKKPYGKKH